MPLQRDQSPAAGLLPYPSMRATLFLVEDDPRLRNYLVELLSGEATLDVVGSASTGADAVEQITRLNPQLALIDLGLPDMTGQQVIAKVSALAKAPLVLAHTVFDDRDNVLEAIRAGASGYVLKGGAPRELIEALHQLAEGGAPMSPRIARGVLRELRGGSAEPDPLSPRERQLLKLVDEGLTYKQISDRLSVSTHTVHSHIKNIYDALHARSRGEALATARSRGLI